MLEQILELILRIFGSNVQEKTPTKPKKQKQQLNFSFPKKKTALNSAEKFIYQNLFAYCRGVDQWKGGNYNGKKYNNIIYVQYGQKYFKVFRLINKGSIYLINKDEISQSQFEHIKGYKNTYCNFVANIFYNYFINNSEYSIPNMQYFNGREQSANDQISNLKQGLHNNDRYEFIEIDKITAVNMAIEGGLCFATLDARIGHIAVFTGRLIKKNPEICQGGLYTGLCTLKKGFGRINIRKIKYYGYVKRK